MTVRRRSWIICRVSYLGLYKLNALAVFLYWSAKERSDFLICKGGYFMKGIFFSPSECTEDRLRRLERLLLLVLSAWLMTSVILGFYVWPWKASAQGAQAPQSLRVSELVVVDPKGVERVRIGGDLPDAVINGKRIPRGEKVAGVMLYDGSGQERGGYVTFEPSGNVALTLDTKKRQSALSAAGPDSGSALVMWSGPNSVDLRSDEDGARITL